MALELPKARPSGAPQSRKRDVPVEAILRVLGNNPYAKALDVSGEALSQAIQQRAELRRNANAITQMAQAAGEEAPTDPRGLTPSSYGSVLQLKDKRSAENREQKRFDAEMKFKRDQLASLDKHRAALAAAKQQQMGKILPQDTINKIANSNTAISEIKNAVNSYNPSFTGPIQGRLSALESVPGATKIPFIGKQIANPDRATFTQNLKFGITKFLYSEAGKQLSDQERNFVMDVINNPAADDTIFKAKLDNAFRMMDEANGRYLTLLSDSGYRVPGREKQTQSDPLMDSLINEGLVMP